MAKSVTASRVYTHRCRSLIYYTEERVKHAMSFQLILNSSSGEVIIDKFELTKFQ